MPESKLKNKKAEIIPHSQLENGLNVQNAQNSIFKEEEKDCQCKSTKKWSSGTLCESLSFLQEDLILKQKTLQSRLSNLASSSRLVVGQVHLQISFIVLFVPVLQKSPQKKPFHLQTESGLRRFIPFLPIDRFNFHRFANFGKLKNFFLLQI